MDTPTSNTSSWQHWRARRCVKRCVRRTKPIIPKFGIVLVVVLVLGALRSVTAKGPLSCGAQFVLLVMIATRSDFSQARVMYEDAYSEKCFAARAQ